MVERYLLQNFYPQRISTYALTLFRHKTEIGGRKVTVDFWDTAGQERFNSMHPCYYHQAHACIMVFDVTRKETYKHLPIWYRELREFRPEIPCLCAANKIDARMEMTEKSFKFAEQNRLPFYFVSAANGINVVKLFDDAIRAGMGYKENATDIVDQILEELERLRFESSASSSRSVSSPNAVLQSPITETPLSGNQQQSFLTTADHTA